MITRTEYTIQIADGESYDAPNSYMLEPIYGRGPLHITQERLEGILNSGVTARLVKREVTMTEWEPAEKED